VPAGHLIRIILASLVAAGAFVGAERGAGVWIGLAVAGAVYVGLAMRLGLVRLDELRALRSSRGAPG